jgi:hypothetical protein
LDVASLIQATPVVLQRVNYRLASIASCAIVIAAMWGKDTLAFRKRAR